MKKFREYLLPTQAIIVYLLSFVLSLILMPIASKFYLRAYNPKLITSGFYIISEPSLELYVGGFFVAYFILLPFFTFALMNKKQWIVWIIGIIIPLILSLSNGVKYTFWAVVLSAIGWILAQVVCLVRKKIKGNI